jgi:hypothetical protein
MEIGEWEKSKDLQKSYPQIIEENPSLNDVKYYAYNGHIEKAVQIAFLFSGYQRIKAIDEIKGIIQNATYLNAGINGDLGEKQLNEVTSIRENLWKEFFKGED